MKSSGDRVALHQDWRWVTATGAELGCWRRCDNGGSAMMAAVRLV